MTNQRVLLGPRGRGTSSAMNTLPKKLSATALLLSCLYLLSKLEILSNFPTEAPSHDAPTHALTLATIQATTWSISNVSPYPPHSSNSLTRSPFIIYHLPNNMVLVHIGKTDGSTLSQNLRHGCHMFVKHPCQRSETKNFRTNGGPGEESRVSELTKGYYHFVPVPAKKHDGYIISSQNPIDRVVSAFLYVHPLFFKETVPCDWWWMQH